MSEQVVLDREAPPWAQRLQTDINALMGRLDRRVKTVNSLVASGSTSLQGQIDTLITDLDAAEATLADTLTDVAALQALQLTSLGLTTLSGTATTVTGIPATAKRVTVAILGLSTNGTSVPVLRLGDSGGIETAGYNGTVSNTNTGTTNVFSGSSGFDLIANAFAATNVIHGALQLILVDPATNTWICTGMTGNSEVGAARIIGGSKALSAVLDRISLTTVGGANTFDAGSVAVIYE